MKQKNVGYAFLVFSFVSLLTASNEDSEYAKHSHKELRKLYTHEKLREYKRAQKEKNGVLYIKNEDAVISEWQNRIEQCDNAWDLMRLEYELDHYSGKEAKNRCKCMIKEREKLIGVKYVCYWPYNSMNLSDISSSHFGCEWNKSTRKQYSDAEYRSSLERFLSNIVNHQLEQNGNIKLAASNMISALSKLDNTEEEIKDFSSPYFEGYSWQMRSDKYLSGGMLKFESHEDFVETKEFKEAQQKFRMEKFNPAMNDIRVAYCALKEAIQDCK